MERGPLQNLCGARDVGRSINKWGFHPGSKPRCARVRWLYVHGYGAVMRDGWDAARSRSVERLQANLTPAPLGYRRGMVAGRQLFFFSHAYRLTGEAIFEDRARRVYADLLSRFWDATNGGWYFSVDDDDLPQDTTKDLYGHAFIMFGLAHYAAIFADVDAVNWIGKTNELVLRHFRLPGGWFASSTTRD